MISLAKTQLPQFLSKEINVMSLDSKCLLKPVKQDLATLCKKMELTPFEQEQLAGRKQTIQQANFLMSRYAIKQCASQWFHYAVDALEVRFDEKKSSLQVFHHQEKLPMSISLSHSQHKLLLCLAFEQIELTLGADIEFLKAGRDVRAMAREVYAQQEIEAIEQSPQPLLKFYQFWTEKEAYAKAIKQPLRVHLSTSVNCKLAEQQLTLTSKRVGDFMSSIVYPKGSTLCWH